MGSCSLGTGESAVEGKHENLEFANFVLLFFKGDLHQALKMTKLSIAIWGMIFSLVTPYLAAASGELGIAKKAAASQATQESHKSDNYEDLRNVFRFVGSEIFYAYPRATQQHPPAWAPLTGKCAECSILLENLCAK